MKLGLLFFLVLSSSVSIADEGKPLWEYGFGVGHVRFEQYPSSDQYTSLSIPFPTFQYRGEVLRADDREGARAYLLKESNYTLEFSGGGTPPVDSSKNRARTGMPDIPFIGYIGPQLVFKSIPGLDLKIATFVAIQTDLRFTKHTGELFEVEMDYRWSTQKNSWGRISMSLIWATRDYLSHFFEIAADQAQTLRPEYQTQSGLHSAEISYFHSFKFDRTSLYVGGTLNDYRLAVNRPSALHKVDQSINYLAGFTYVLGESERRSVPADQGDGLFEKLQRRANQAL